MKTMDIDTGHAGHVNTEVIDRSLFRSGISDEELICRFVSTLNMSQEEASFYTALLMGQQPGDLVECTEEEMLAIMNDRGDFEFEDE